VTEHATSDEADPLYQPLGGIEPWAAAPIGAIDLGTWQSPEDRAWTDLVARGVLLAAAHQSGALDGMHDGDRGVALSLLRGVSSLAAVADDARAHVRANYDGLRLAQVATDGDVASDAWIRRVHEVACRPQLTHAVHGESGVQDHVLATGDYKHHPNHARTASGDWVAHAPVSRLPDEMGRFLAVVGSAEFAGLHPYARAAFVHHAIGHIAPFADGNGRVARVLASAYLLRTPGAVPFLVFADEASGYEATIAGTPAELVALVERQARTIVGMLADLRRAGNESPEQAAALDRWRRRAAAGTALEALLAAATERALDRHRRRADLGWLSPLTEAEVTPGLLIRVPPTDVDEALVVDAHPLLDDGVLVLRAEQARLHLDVSPDDLLPAVSPALVARLDPWLDRVVSTLALRVAAELE
jgi:hypothetical protein